MFKKIVIFCEGADYIFDEVKVALPSLNYSVDIIERVYSLPEVELRMKEATTLNQPYIFILDTNYLGADETINPLLDHLKAYKNLHLCSLIFITAEESLGVPKRFLLGDQSVQIPLMVIDNEINWGRKSGMERNQYSNTAIEYISDEEFAKRQGTVH